VNAAGALVGGLVFSVIGGRLAGTSQRILVVLGFCFVFLGWPISFFLGCCDFLYSWGLWSPVRLRRLRGQACQGVLQGGGPG